MNTHSRAHVSTTDGAFSEEGDSQPFADLVGEELMTLFESGS
jgi:hypothetical protein